MTEVGLGANGLGEVTSFAKANGNFLVPVDLVVCVDKSVSFRLTVLQVDGLNRAQTIRAGV